MEKDEGLPEDNEWWLDPDDLEFGEKIGGGNFGAVYKVGFPIQSPLIVNSSFVDAIASSKTQNPQNPQNPQNNRGSTWGRLWQ